MGINVVRYQEEDPRWGVLKEGYVYPVQGEYASLASFLKKGVEAAREVAASPQEPGLEIGNLDLLSPVTSPAQIICQGANYGAHREEAGLNKDRPPFNLIFTKAPSSVTGPNNDIVCPDNVKLLDYEIELGLVFQQELDGSVVVTEENFEDYISGFVIANDVSARDTQFTEGQWFKGKSYRTFCPVGPILYLLDEGEGRYVHQLELTLKVNGDVRQSAHTEQLLYKPEETLTELSKNMSFYPGDLLLTGTPGGVALKLAPEDLDVLGNAFTSLSEKMERLIKSQENNSSYLKAGDVVTSEIKSTDGKIHLGVQTNKVV